MKSIYFLIITLGLIACQRKTDQQELNHWRTFTSYDSLGQIEMTTDTSKWIEIKPIPGQLKIDLMYATTANFTGQQLYQCPRCFLTNETANAFYKFVDALNQQGYQVLLLDCYRPRRVQQILYDAYPSSEFIKSPMNAPMPNRGMSVTITLLDQQGQPLDMGSKVNQFDSTSYHENFNLSYEIIDRRKALRETGRSLGFQAVKYKWWEYNFRHTSALANDYIWPCQD